MEDFKVIENSHEAMDEWREFCGWIETLPYSELILKATGLDNNTTGKMEE